MVQYRRPTKIKLNDCNRCFGAGGTTWRDRSLPVQMLTQDFRR
jgi:hypothetical protein